MNATHEHFSSWRHTIMENADLAVIWHTGLSDPGALSSIDRLRFDLAMQEWFWSNYHYWDRARVGAIPENWIPAALEATTSLLIENPGARKWWELHKGQFSADFQAAIDKADV